MPKGFRFIPIISALLACLPFSSLAGPDVQARYEKALKAAQSMTNVEIEFTDTLSLPHGFGTNKAPLNGTYHYSFIASGPKYYAESKRVSDSDTPLVSQHEDAFDGEMYRSYDTIGSLMNRGRSKPVTAKGEISLNPLVAPFIFLKPGSDSGSERLLHLADIGSNATTNRLILQGHSTNGLLEILLPGPEEGKQPSTWKILIDDNGDSFAPSMITADQPGNKIEMVDRLLNYTNLGGCQFPTRIEWSIHSSTSPSTLIATGTVALVSVRIPASIPDSIFNLANEEKSAEDIWDRDQKDFVDDSGNLLRPKTATRPEPRIYDKSAASSKSSNALLVFFTVSEEMFPGGKYIDTPDLPKTGFIASKPDLIVTNLVDAHLENRTHSQQSRLLIKLSPEDGKHLSALTKKSIAKKVLVMLGDKPLVAPVVTMPIDSSEFAIDFNDSAEAKSILEALKKLIRE